MRHPILFHHDPACTDDARLAIEAEARASLTGAGSRCTAAYEGMICGLG